jgi:Flp pilus assembly protein TadG
MRIRKIHGSPQMGASRVSRKQGERGSALVEFGLCMPILMALLIGAVEYGRMVFATIEVSNAAMAGVQYGVQNPADAADLTGIQNAASADAPDITLGTTSTSVSCICSDGSASTCQPTDCSGKHIETILTVNTQAQFNSIFRVPGLSNSFTLKGRAVEKVIQ